MYTGILKIIISAVLKKFIHEYLVFAAFCCRDNIVISIVHMKNKCTNFINFFFPTILI